MKTLKLILIFIACTCLFGCASGARMENMIYSGNQKEYSEKLKENVEVSSCSGGKKTNPAWTSEIDDEAFSGAVKKSLLSQGLLSDNGKYKLQIKMIKLDQPLFGFDMKVTSHVQYILTDSTNNSVVLDETIIAPYTATVNDAFYGVKRLMLANEGSGKKNIEGLLEKLSTLQISPKEISIVQ